MFVHMSYNRLVRNSSALSGASETLDVGRLGSQEANATEIVLALTNRTTGTLTVTTYGSHDGSNYFILGSDLDKSVTTERFSYIELKSALPVYLRLVMATGDGFDGLIRVSLRSDKLILPRIGTSTPLPT